MGAKVDNVGLGIVRFGVLMASVGLVYWVVHGSAGSVAFWGLMLALFLGLEYVVRREPKW